MNAFWSQIAAIQTLSNLLVLVLGANLSQSNFICPLDFCKSLEFGKTPPSIHNLVVVPHMLFACVLDHIGQCSDLTSGSSRGFTPGGLEF